MGHDGPFGFVRAPSHSQKGFVPRKLSNAMNDTKIPGLVKSTMGEGNTYDGHCEITQKQILF